MEIIKLILQSVDVEIYYKSGQILFDVLVFQRKMN